MCPLASKLLVLDPYEISNPKLNNQHISRFCLLKMGLFRLWRVTIIKPRHIESYFFFCDRHKQTWIGMTVDVAVGQHSSGRLATMLVDHYLPLFFFSVFSNRTAPWIKRLILWKLTGVPKNLGLYPFPDPSTIFGHPGGHFFLGFHRKNDKIKKISNSKKPETLSFFLSFFLSVISLKFPQQRKARTSAPKR